MSKINDIKYFNQLSYRKVIALTGHSYGTIKKYEEAESFNLPLKKIRITLI